MATANMQINQAGLSAGVAGKARLDGKPDGALVTLVSASPGTTNRFRLLYVPPADTTAIASLAATGGGAQATWTFTPTVGVRGPYLVELIVDEGLAGEARQKRVFGVAGWRHRIVAPALNEGGDPTARTGLTGLALTTALGRTDRNVDRDGVNSVDGWQRALVEIVEALELGSFTQVSVPDGGLCVIPDGQVMFFQGPLSGDYQGDLREIVAGAAAPVEETAIEWGPIRDTPGTFALTAGEKFINRYSTQVDGLFLNMPTPADGMVVNLKEVVGWTGEGDPFAVTLFTGSGEGDPRDIESPLGVPGDGCSVADQGIFCRWVYDGSSTTWRLTTYFRPSGPA